MIYDYPDVVTPMTFNITKAQLTFSTRIGLDVGYVTSALFEGKTEIIQTPGDMFIFTIHRENGSIINAGVTYEFAEEI